jgi:D-lactate dehydrogenase (cytochrome)
MQTNFACVMTRNETLHKFLETCQTLDLPLQVTELDPWLGDESKLRGRASAVIKAKTADHVAQTLKTANEFGVEVTVSAARTSLTGSSVPFGGIAMDVSGINQVDQKDCALAGPGIILSEYKKAVAEHGFFFPPDPTSEDSCSLGGIAATNASGAQSYHYGPTRDWIDGLQVVLPTGRMVEIERGAIKAANGALTIPGSLLSPQKRHDLTIPVPVSKMPDWRICKNAAGLYSSPEMDLIDLFIGAEGILGVITGLKTKPAPERKPFFGLKIYLRDRDQAIVLIRALDLLKGNVSAESYPPEDIVGKIRRLNRISPLCIEWLGKSTLKLIDRNRRDEHYGALYLEQEYDDAAEILTQFTEFIDLVSNGESLKTELAMDDNSLRRIKRERQSVPEKLNEMVKPGLTKLGTDFSLPRPKLRELFEIHDRLPEDKTFVFGHVGNTHLHANLMPESPEEADRFREIIYDAAKEVINLGGSVSAEHGIGKIKRNLLNLMIGDDAIRSIRQIKSVLDPKWILNPGNMIDREMSCHCEE